MIIDNRTFDFVFNYETSTGDFWGQWIGSKEELTSLKSKLEETFKKSFPQLFDIYYNEWNLIITSATDDLHSYINIEVDRAIKEINPKNDLETKAIVLSSKWVFQKINEYISNEPNKCIINLDNTSIMVTQKAFFHIVWGHYFRLKAVNLRERNKSLFDHSKFEFLIDLAIICPALYHFESFGVKRKVFLIEYKSKIYTIVLKKKIKTMN
jgi:hypothetical protein